jgi:hypothetical protein
MAPTPRALDTKIVLATIDLRIAQSARIDGFIPSLSYRWPRGASPRDEMRRKIREGRSQPSHNDYTSSLAVYIIAEPGA